MNIEPIERCKSLSRADFLENFYMRRPVVVENACNNNWDEEFLVRQVGDAKVAVNIYQENSSDYSKVAHSEINIRDYFAHLKARSLLRRFNTRLKQPVMYIFNHPSCTFARNEDRAELHTGWGATLNPKLAPLWDEFKFPNFIHPVDFAFAMIIIGSAENSTLYHFDNGGAAKALAQISGNKHVIVCAPSEATHFDMQPMFYHAGSPSTNISTGKISLRESNACGFETEIKPGDVLYWPSFWFHDIQNLGEDINIAVGLSLAEIKAHPLLLRHFSGEVLRKLISFMNPDKKANAIKTAADVKVSYGDTETTLIDLFKKYEELLLDESLSQKKSLLEWNNI